jgi:hypothetical protein
MKHWKFVLVGVLFFVAYQEWGPEAESLKPTSRHQRSKALISFTTKKYPPVPPARPLRSPASLVHKKRIKRSISVALGENPIKIGKSFRVVDGVMSLQKDQYKSPMGKKISEDNRYVFFQPASNNSKASPVALDTVNQRLFPVSHILHVKGVDAGLRAQFKAEGMEEYYYHARLKLVSLETSPSTVLKQYQELTARGLDVRLEVLKDAPRSK